MPKGIEIRAAIDTENAMGFLLVNGGGAVVLLTFLPEVLGNPEYAPSPSPSSGACCFFRSGSCRR